MRARALHADAIVLTSSLLQVNCVLLRGRVGQEGGDDAGGEGGALNVVHVQAGGMTDGAAESFVVDSPVLPEELEMLPSVLSQAGFPAPSGLLATHADWDHVLAPLAFPGTPLGCAESSAARLREEPGEAQRELRSFDEELYLERPRPLGLGAIQALPVPGRLEIGERSLELHETGGHTPDGMAILAEWAGVLIAGDYLSEIEIPMLNPGANIDAYLGTLERLRPLLDRVEQVVPGHGPVLAPGRAVEILEEDVAYLRALGESGINAELPEGRRSAEMKKLHARNAGQLGD